jgi:hypothetical protein
MELNPNRLRRGQLAKPKSQVVRDAILDFHDRLGRLSERERLHKLQLFDQLVPKIPVSRRTKIRAALMIVIDTSVLIDVLVGASARSRIRARFLVSSRCIPQWRTRILQNR